MTYKALDFKDYTALVHKLTHELVQQAQRRGIRLERSDVFQELAIIWMSCAEKFNPELGFGFAAYFRRAVINGRLDIIRRLCGKDAGLKTDSFSDFLQDPLHTEADGVSNRMMEAFVGEITDNATPEAIYMEREAIERQLATNPLFAKLTEMVINPPEEIKEQLKLFKAQSEWAVKMGLGAPKRAPKQVTISMLMKAFRLNWQYKSIMQNAMENAYA